MSAEHVFDNALAQRLDAVYRTPEMVDQRRATIQALAPSQGEKLLDVGTGPGLLALELADHVGREGRVTGIDVSADMLTVAEQHRQRSPHRDALTFSHGDAGALAFDDASFDALASTQVYEYLDDVDEALREAHRVLRPGGRLVVVDTDWDSLVWHADDRARMLSVIEAWTQRFTDPHLPTTLRRRLKATGFVLDAVQVVPVLNADFDPDTYSARHIDIVSDFVQAHGIAPSDAAAWASDVRARAESDEYFFSLNRYLFTARKRQRA
jgi:ubiquinone/menaquinone biosynthesis C-methylase UbiE